MKNRLVVGCMSGTSMDGLDAALVEIVGSGLGIQARFVRMASRGFGEFGDVLGRLAAQKAVSPRRIATAALELGELHRELVAEVAGDDAIDLVCLHGQTVLHEPPLSWQLVNPAPVAHGLGVPVVSDLRAADLACGGQGAPITPLADYLLFRDPDETRAIVNLGGFCNVTILPPSALVERIGGGDVCACNQLLDELSRRLLDRPFDEDGAEASLGIVRARAYLDLAELLAAQSEEGRSLGTGDELWQVVDQLAAEQSPADALRTACAAIAKVTSDSMRGVDRLLLAGGGTRNAVLVEELRERCGATVELTEDHGVPVQAREAVCMAVLGALCQDREPITLPQVTHVEGDAPISGVWTLP